MLNNQLNTEVTVGLKIRTIKRFSAKYSRETRLNNQSLNGKHGERERESFLRVVCPEMLM